MQLRAELRSAVQGVRDAVLRRDRGQLQLRTGVFLSKVRPEGRTLRPVHHIVRAEQHRRRLRLNQRSPWKHLRAAMQR